MAVEASIFGSHPIARQASRIQKMAEAEVARQTATTATITGMGAQLKTMVAAMQRMSNQLSPGRVHGQNLLVNSAQHLIDLEMGTMLETEEKEGRGNSGSSSSSSNHTNGNTVLGRTGSGTIRRLNSLVRAHSSGSGTASPPVPPTDGVLRIRSGSNGAANRPPAEVSSDDSSREDGGDNIGALSGRLPIHAQSELRRMLGSTASVAASNDDVDMVRATSTRLGVELQDVTNRTWTLTSAALSQRGKKSSAAQRSASVAPAAAAASPPAQAEEEKATPASPLARSGSALVPAASASSPSRPSTPRTSTPGKRARGRPPGAKDAKPRKKRTPPRSGMEPMDESKAEPQSKADADADTDIEDYLDPFYDDDDTTNGDDGDDGDDDAAADQENHPMETETPAPVAMAAPTKPSRSRSTRSAAATTSMPGHEDSARSNAAEELKYRAANAPRRTRANVERAEGRLRYSSQG